MLCMGCVATAPPAPSTSDMAAKDLIFVPERSNIYVFQAEGALGQKILFQVFLDGRFWGGIGAGTYLLAETPPGTHSIAAFSHENQDSVDLKVEEGKNYYLEMEAKLGETTFRVTMKQVEEEVGRRGVVACQRAEGRKLFP